MEPTTRTVETALFDLAVRMHYVSVLPLRWTGELDALPGYLSDRVRTFLASHRDDLVAILNSQEFLQRIQTPGTETTRYACIPHVPDVTRLMRGSRSRTVSSRSGSALAMKSRRNRQDMKPRSGMKRR